MYLSLYALYTEIGQTQVFIFFKKKTMDMHEKVYIVKHSYVLLESIYEVNYSNTRIYHVQTNELARKT